MKIGILHTENLKPAFVEAFFFSFFLPPEQTQKQPSNIHFQNKVRFWKCCFVPQHNQILGIVCSRCTEQVERSCGLTSWLRLPERKRKKPKRCVCSCSCCTFQNPECAGCEATVSHGAPAHRSFCLATALRRSVSVPHRSLFALQHLRRIRSACQETFQPWMPVMGFYSRRCWPTV